MQMLSQMDIYRTAQLLIRQHGDAAILEAARRADHLNEEGNRAGFHVWRAVIAAVQEIQNTTPPKNLISH